MTQESGNETRNGCGGTAMTAGCGCGNGVLFVGSVMVDVICSVPRLPLSGQGVVSSGVVSRLGGCAFNSANIARQLSGAAAAFASGASDAAPQVALFAPVGVGPYGIFVTEQLAARGMSAFAPENPPCDSGAALCLIEPDGERTMLTLPGIERRFEPAWFEALETGCRGIDLTRFGSVNICGYEVGGSGGDALVSFLERHPELEPWFAPGPSLCTIDPAVIARINALRPVWHLNDAEVTSFIGAADLNAAGRALSERCQNTVIVTAGPDGTYVFVPGQDVLHVPTKPVRPVDTIGAGDSNLGAFMTARACGLSWQRAAEIANAVAGAVCGVEGSILSDEEFAVLCQTL